MENTIKTTEIVNGIQVTIPKAAKNIIKSFEDVNAINGNGKNICAGCEFEHCGSCYEHCEADNFAHCNRQAERHGVKRVPVNKYHIVTYSHDSGDDDKEDVATLKLADKLAKAYASDSYYYKVRIFCNHKIVREYVDGKAVKVVEAEQMDAAKEAAANLQYAAIETPDLNFDLGLKPEDVNAIAQGMADNTPAVEAVAAQDYVLNQFAGFTDEQLISAAEYIATDKISTRVEAVEFLVWHAAWDIREMESEQVSDEDEAQAESEAQAEEQTRRKTAERISEQAERLHDIINAHWDMKKMCFPEVWNRRYLKVCKLHRKYIDNIYKAAEVSDNDGARKNNAVWRHFAVPASVYAK